MEPVVRDFNWDLRFVLVNELSRLSADFTLSCTKMKPKKETSELVRLTLIGFDH